MSGQLEGQSTPEVSIAEARQLQMPQSAPHTAYFERWAIIVGVSTYEQTRCGIKNLRFARADAEAFRELLRSPYCGGFDDDHVRLLCDEQATTGRIQRTLRSFLRKAGSDDLVLLYFAGHAVPDADKPGSLYILTHDTDPDDIPGTAVPRREIDSCLRESTKAKHVLVILDTCHSGGIGGVGDPRSAAHADLGLEAWRREISSVRGGTSILTSSSVDEVSREDARWGGGHGVFTHHLLEGLRDLAADGADGSARDGLVTFDEIFEYVKRHVEADTNKAQSPTRSQNAVSRLPLAVRRDLVSMEHQQIGRALHRAGQLLLDRRLFRAAAERFLRAAELAEVTQLQELRVERGLAMLASGDPKSAVDMLADAAARDLNRSLPDAAYYLGISRAMADDSEGAQRALAQFAAHFANDERRPWAEQLQEALVNRGTPSTPQRRRALLIGIDEYPALSLNSTGCVNDVHDMEQALVKLGFEDRIVLCDAQATRDKILQSLDSLAAESKSEDALVVFYSGLGSAWMRDSEIDTSLALFTHDIAKASDTWVGGIEPTELHERLSVVKASTLLIIDGQPRPELHGLAARDGSYALVLGTIPGEAAVARTFSGTMHGVFSHALVTVFNRGGLSGLSVEALVRLVRDEMISQQLQLETESMRGLVAPSRSTPAQQPIAAGNAAQPLFEEVWDASSFLALTELSLHGAVVARTLRELQMRYDSARRHFGAHLPAEIARAFGRAFLVHGDYRRAHIVFRELTCSRESLLDAALAELGVGLCRTAAIKLHSFLETPRAALLTSEDLESLNALVATIETSLDGQKQALLIACSGYSGNAALAMAETLKTRCGFPPNAVRLLVGPDASRSRILQELERTVVAAGHQCALVLFAGFGNLGPSHNPYVAFDEKAAFVTLEEIRKLAAAGTNVVTLVDAPHWAFTTGEPPEVAMVQARELAVDTPTLERIGRLLIYDSDPVERGKPGGQVGSLTMRLLAALPRDPATISWERWVALANSDLPGRRAITLVGEGRNEPLFSNGAMLSVLQRLRGANALLPLREAVPLLRRVSQQYSAPEDYFYLGIANLLLGDGESSLRALAQALPIADAHPEVHDYYGRALLAAGQLEPAMAELQEATRRDPDTIGAYFYLGKAIGEFIERDKLREAVDAMRKYLRAGAPLGNGPEAQDLLDRWVLKPVPSPSRRSDQ